MIRVAALAEPVPLEQSLPQAIRTTRWFQMFQPESFSGKILAQGGDEKLSAYMNTPELKTPAWLVRQMQF
jgi:hypothetical protein